MKSLVVVSSYHHKNTEKIAGIIAKTLDAQVKTPRQVNPEELQEYELICFGSGIYGGKNHRALLNLADKLPKANNKKAFIFSTSGVTKKRQPKMHEPLAESLQSKGYTIAGEFNCKGFNTNSFLKYFGGMNKGRPNTHDLRQVEEAVQNLKKRLQEE